MTSALLELLPTGVVTAEIVARTLSLSERTLQRWLRGDGTTFLALMASTRESLACHYLRESQLPAAEISFLLGCRLSSSQIWLTGSLSTWCRRRILSF